MSKAPGESRVPTLARRSGLPRLTSHFPAVLNPRNKQPSPIDSDLSPIEQVKTSALSRFQPLALKRVFSSHKDRITSATEPSKQSCTSWIPSFTKSPLTSPLSPQNEDHHALKETWRDDSSTFSKQLAQITSGTDEDFWGSCSPCLSKPRPVWPADGGHAGETDNRKLSKDCVGRRVLINGKEDGILRYFGRTAFANGNWCGIELEKPVGKNNGSVDDVIYFSCLPYHGIFAPADKVSLLKFTEAELPMKRAKYGTPSNKTIYRLSAGSSSSNSSGISDESKRSAATYTIAGRRDSSLPTTPEEYKLSKLTNRNSTGDFSETMSPGDGTYEDSSLGILSPDQMHDFTGSASIGRSPSDDEIEALEDEICDGMEAVGGTDCIDKPLENWDSEGSISDIEDELLQKDISAIIRELKRKENDNSSTSSSPSIPTTILEEPSQASTTESSFVCDMSVRSKTHSTPEHVLHLKDKSVKFLNEEKQKPIEKKIELPMIKQVDQIKQESYLKFLKKDLETSDISDYHLDAGGAGDMATSSASIDQGYQGDGEFDVPSEAGSVTASSPIEDTRISDMDQMVVDSHSSAITDAEASLADDEVEMDSGIVPRDRSARIIDGKLYHNHRELVVFRQAEVRQHDVHTSEMDSSGFFSDLDPRDEDSNRLEPPSLQPLRESKLDVDLNDSVLDDTTRADEDIMEYASVTKIKFDNSNNSQKTKHSNNVEESSLIEEEEKSTASTIQSELKDICVSDHNEPVPSDSSTATNLNMEYKHNDEKNLPPTNESPKDESKEFNSDEKSIETVVGDKSLDNQDKLNKEKTNPENDEATANAKCELENSAPVQKPRNYEKPWNSKPPPPRKVEKPKPVLPPPPPMPKKNVQSKLKALLEASAAEASAKAEEQKAKQLVKKTGKWDNVMNKIEESKKEDKVKTKPKEVKSRLMEALQKAPQPVSPAVERIRQERKERRERRERQVAATAAQRRLTERKRSSVVASNRTSRAPSLDSLGCPPVDSRASTPDLSQHSSSSSGTNSGSSPPTSSSRTSASRSGSRVLPTRASTRHINTNSAVGSRKGSTDSIASNRRLKVESTKINLGPKTSSTRSSSRKQSGTFCYTGTQFLSKNKKIR